MVWISAILALGCPLFIVKPMKADNPSRWPPICGFRRLAKTAKSATLHYRIDPDPLALGGRMFATDNCVTILNSQHKAVPTFQLHYRSLILWAVGCDDAGYEVNDGLIGRPMTVNDTWWSLVNGTMQPKSLERNNAVYTSRVYEHAQRKEMSTSAYFW